MAAEVTIAPGYTIRSLGDGLELLERCYASGLGFHEGDIKVAVENRDDPPGIATSKMQRNTVATSTWWLSPPMEPSPPFARYGLTM